MFQQQLGGGESCKIFVNTFYTNLVLQPKEHECMLVLCLLPDSCILYFDTNFFLNAQEIILILTRTLLLWFL
jgi:hypothetical protein